MFENDTKTYRELLMAVDIKRSGAIEVKDEKNIHHVIRVSSITYCEAWHRNCIIHTDYGDILAKIRFSDVEKLLKEKNLDMFMCVHKSYLINKLDAVSIRRYEILMRGNHHIPVSQDRYKEVMEWLMK